MVGCPAMFGCPVMVGCPAMVGSGVLLTVGSGDLRACLGLVADCQSTVLAARCSVRTRDATIIDSYNVAGLFNHNLLSVRAERTPK